ncbi:DUF3592 domain-containing protein [Rhodopirellula sp. SWK7]|uniref:DUF3592 domain-containing protein n=1 Tax=Rhodopirellula sp. SWK7 TaxID=595460 RepID=UPI0002BF4630|nr:DUF3592 domain-containing protein [Rhodopirellula sp. SWK7]EMI46032.1 putative membrane protein [Rhodopirellula sp. SWK7]
MCGCHPPTPDQIHSVAEVFQTQGKIEAIKFVRETFRLSLMESKEFVEQHVNRSRPKQTGSRLRAASGDTPNSQISVPPHETSIERGTKNQPQRTWQPSRFLALQTLLWCTLAAIMFATAYYTWSSQQQLIARSQMVIADVVSMRSTEGGAQRPVFEYQIHGKDYRWERSISSNPPRYSVGDSAELYVDPDRPTNVLVNDWLHRWFFIGITSFFGVAFSLAAFICMFMFTAFRTPKFRTPIAPTSNTASAFLRVT